MAPQQKRSNRRNNRRCPSVFENLQRLAAEITGGIPGNRSSIVWPKAQGCFVPHCVRRENRKLFVPPSVLPPSYCQHLNHEMTHTPRERKELSVLKRSGFGLDAEDVAVENALQILRGGMK